MLLQVDSDAVRREQQEAIERVTAAVIAAQEILAGGSLATGKRKAGLSAADKPSKRARIYGFEDFDESDSDNDSEYEAAAQLNKTGHMAAAASSGNYSDASAQEVALSIARDYPVPPHSRHLSGGSAEQSAAAASSHSGAPSADIPSSSATKPTALSPGGKPPLRRSLSRSQPVTDADEPAAAAAAAAAVVTLGNSPAATDGKTSLSAAEEPSSSKQTTQEPAVHEHEPAVDESPIELSDYNSPAELEAVGMIRLKHELARHGLKCGGSLSERAARLFLLTATPVDKLDRKHFSKASKKT